MSWFSEKTDAEKAGLAALGLISLGAATAEGREGFKESIPTGLGTLFGSGLKTVVKTPVDIGKGAAAGLGLTELSKKGEDSGKVIQQGALGNIDLKKLLGLQPKEEEASGPSWVMILLIAGVALAAILLLKKVM